MSKIKEQINKLEKESGIKSHELRNICEQIKRSKPSTSQFFFEKTVHSATTNVITTSFVLAFFMFVSHKKTRKNAPKMQGTKNKSGISKQSK